MAECQLIEKCVFFNDRMSGMPTTAESMKKRYCLGDNSMCARYMVFAALGRENVPPDLFPSNLEKGHQLIGK